MFAQDSSRPASVTPSPVLAPDAGFAYASITPPADPTSEPPSADTPAAAPPRASALAAHPQTLGSWVGASLVLTQIKEPAEVMPALLALLAQHIPFEHAIIWLLDGEGWLHASATQGDEPDQKRPGEDERILPLAPDAEPLITLRRIMQSGQPLLIADTAQFPGWPQLPGRDALRCWLGAPLIAHDHLLGFCTLAHSQPGMLQDPHAMIAAALTAQAALAFANAQMLKDAQERAHELEAAAALTAHIRHAASVHQGAALCLESILSGCALAQGCILLAEPDRQQWTLAALLPLQPELLGRAIAAEAGDVGRVISAGKPIATCFNPEDPLLALLAEGGAKLPAIQRCLWLPLLIDGDVRGVLQAGATELAFPTPAQKRLLTALADTTGMILTRLRLHEMLEQQVEARTHELQRRQQAAEGLRYILTILNSNRPLPEVLEYILSQACWLLDADMAAIYQCVDATAPLQVLAARDVPAKILPRFTTGTGRSVLDHLMQTGRPDWIDLHSPRERRLLLAGDDDPLPFSAILLAPLVIAEEMRGCFVLYFNEARALIEEEVGLAIALSDQAALAIETAWLRARAEQSAIEAERSRLARELHDAVTQSLFAASIIADVLPNLSIRNPDLAAQQMTELRRLTHGALAEMRNLLVNLRPHELTQITLDVLLRNLIVAAANRSDIHYELEVANPGPLPPEVQIALYRIAQEALNNVAKHAQARQVKVALRVLTPPPDVHLALCITDDGIGFESEQPGIYGLGLKIMHERAAAIAADLHIHGQPGHGACIELIWPRSQPSLYTPE